MIASRVGFCKPLPDTLSMAQMLPRGGPRDITREIDKRFFIPFPKGKKVAKASCIVVGAQGCGKSVLEESRVKKAYEMYGKDRVHVIYTDDIRIAIREIDDHPVQYIIIDDAMTHASSRQVFNQADIIKDYNRSRHIFEEKIQGGPGLILYDWCWQRFGELDPAFRQSDVMIFKSGIAEPSERKKITDFIGPYYTRILWQIWDRINTGHDEVKSLSVGCIASKLEVGAATGIYHSEYEQGFLPPMLKETANGKGYAPVVPPGASCGAPESTSQAGDDAQHLPQKTGQDKQAEPTSVRMARKNPRWARRMKVWDLRQAHKNWSIAQTAKASGETAAYVRHALADVRALLKAPSPDSGPEKTAEKVRAGHARA